MSNTPEKHQVDYNADNGNWRSIILIISLSLAPSY